MREFRQPCRHRCRRQAGNCQHSRSLVSTARSSGSSRRSSSHDGVEHAMERQQRLQLLSLGLGDGWLTRTHISAEPERAQQTVRRQQPRAIECATQRICVSLRFLTQQQQMRPRPCGRRAGPVTARGPLDEVW